MSAIRELIEAVEAQVREMREAGLKAADIAESWVREQLEGTTYFDESLAEVAAIRATLTGEKP